MSRSFHDFYPNHDDDIVIGSLIYDLTGNQFGATFEEQTPELLWLSEVINQMDLSQIITDSTLKIVDSKFEMM